MTTTAELPSWAARLVGDDAVVVEVFSGGTSRATLLVEVPSERRRLVVRHDGGSGPLSGSGFTLGREAAAARFAQAAGVPVADVVSVSDDGTSVAVTELPGEPAGPRDALDHYLSLLGRLHVAPLESLPDGHRGFDVLGRDDLAMWRELTADRVEGDVPVLDAAFDLLDRHGYTSPADVVFCHGDAGTGNYLSDGDRVTGLIDWEMSHTGDPHDDLASIAVRAVLAGVELDDFVARVEAHWSAASGRSFDTERYRLAVVAVLTRMVVSCHVALSHPDPAHDRTVQLMGLPLMEAHLVRAAALVDGIELAQLDDGPADPAFLARMAQLLSENGPTVDPADASERRRARRIRYIADQLAEALVARSDDRPADAGDIHGLWRDAHRRLAAVPASQPLATLSIPGVG